MNEKPLIYALILVLAGLLLTACGGSEPDLVGTRVAVERAAAATLTAEAPTPQPAPTEVALAPTVTLIPSSSPSSTALQIEVNPVAGTGPTGPVATEPTSTPTPTSTPIQIHVDPPASPTSTLTPTPTPSPTPTPTPIHIHVDPPGGSPPPPPCAFPAQGMFAGLWQTYRSRLGCPLHQQPKPLQDAEQAFDNGHMFWRQDAASIYVVYAKGGLSGTYQAFADMWSEGDPEYSCVASPPPGRVQPKRGFGAVWCVLGGPSAAIGWGLAEEAGFGPGNREPVVQDFEHGCIFRDSDGTAKGLAYLLFSDEMEFVRTAY